MISTSALEMGIDIGGLDACVLVGYPGTVTQTWQRGGRVGRTGRESVVMMIAQADALDQYFMRYPDNFFSRGCELAFVDPENPYIVADHLECAAAEIPLERAEREQFSVGWAETAGNLLDRGAAWSSAFRTAGFSAPQGILTATCRYAWQARVLRSWTRNHPLRGGSARWAERGQWRSATPARFTFTGRASIELRGWTWRSATYMWSAPGTLTTR